MVDAAGEVSYRARQLPGHRDLASQSWAVAGQSDVLNGPGLHHRAA
jgi:hypothetical protein